MELTSDFNWQTFNKLTEPEIKEIVRRHEDELVDLLINRFRDLKENKNQALELGCRLITHLHQADHIDEISKTMAETKTWPDNIWQRTEADYAIVGIVKSIVGKVLPRDFRKDVILVDSFYEALKEGNELAAREILQHLPIISEDLSLRFVEGSALEAAIAYLPNLDFISEVIAKEPWDQERVKNQIEQNSKTGLKPSFKTYLFILTAYALSTSDQELLTFLQSQKEPNFLHNACETGNPKIVKTLLNLGFNANQKNHNGLTPIFFAKDPQNIDLLLQAGADINQNVHSLTPLEQAISNYSPTVAHLLDRGAKTSNATLANYLLMNKGSLDPQIVERLIVDKEKIKIEALRYFPECIPYVLKKHPELEPQFKRHIIPMLTKDMPSRPKMYETIRSMNWGDQKLIDFLKSFNGDWMVEACRESNVEVAEQLVDLGASRDIASYFAALQTGSPELLELHRGYEVHPDKILSSMIEDCSPNDIQLLVSMGADIEAKNSYGTALAKACFYENVPVIKTLINIGADVQTALRTDVLQDMGESLPTFLDFVLQKRPDYKGKIIAVIREIPTESLNEHILRSAIHLDLKDVIEQCIKERVNFLAEDAHGKSALDEMLAYEMDVLEMINQIPHLERLDATSLMPEQTEEGIQRLPTSELALALTIPDYRKRLLGLSSLEFLHGSLMVFFAKLSFQEMSRAERYALFKKFSSTQQKDYLKNLPIEEQQTIITRYLKDNPPLDSQVKLLQDNLYKPLQNGLGLIDRQDESDLTFVSIYLKSSEDALTMLKNKTEPFLSRLQALEFLAQNMTLETFPIAQFKDIENAVNSFNKDVGAFDAKLLAFGQELKKQPQWHPSVSTMQKHYQAMMKAQGETVKNNMGGASQVILAKITQNTPATNTEFSVQVEALSKGSKKFKKNFLALIADPQYIVYLKNWTPQDDSETYTSNFNDMPNQVNDLTNAAGKSILEDNRIDYDTLYKLIYALPHFDLQKTSYGPDFGEYLLTLTVKLES